MDDYMNFDGDPIVKEARKFLPSVYDYPDNEFYVEIAQPEQAKVITEEFNPSPTMPCTPAYVVKFRKQRDEYTKGVWSDKWALDYLKLKS